MEVQEKRLLGRFSGKIEPGSCLEATLLAGGTSNFLTAVHYSHQAVVVFFRFSCVVGMEESQSAGCINVQREVLIATLGHIHAIPLNYRLLCVQ